MNKELEEFLEEIERVGKSNLLVVVEGTKDREALRSVGIYNVVTINKALFLITEEIAENTKECILLTDLDAEGKKTYAKLKKHLNDLGVQINDRFRNFLFKKTQLRQIEGMQTYLRNLDRKIS